MNRTGLVVWLLGLALVVLLPGTASGAPQAEDPVEAPEPIPVEDAPRETVRRHGDLVSVFGGELHVPADVEQWGDVVAVGADARIEGRVRGSVVVVAGNLLVTGEVNDSVIGVFAGAEVRDAEIDDQLVNVLGTLDRESTRVGGQEIDLGFGEGRITLARWFGVLGAFLFWARMLRLFVIFMILILLVVLVPERIRLISEETPHRLAMAFFVGLLGYLAFWIVAVLLSVTLIGVILAWLLFIVLKWLGIAGMFHFFGHRVGRSLGREMSLLGAVLIGFVPYILLILLPSAFGLPGLIVALTLGLILWLFLEVPAVGMALLTRFGTRSNLTPVPAGSAVMPASAMPGEVSPEAPRDEPPQPETREPEPPQQPET